MLDKISNEYSVFYINDSQFPISQSYQIYENNTVKILEKILKSYFHKANKLELIRYFRNSDFINLKLINRTRKRLIETICTIISKICEDEIYMVYKEYLVSNIFTTKDAEMFLKAFDSTE